MDSHRLTFGSITQTPELSTARLQSHCEETSLALLDHTFGDESKHDVAPESTEEPTTFVQSRLYQTESHNDSQLVPPSQS